VSANKVRVLSLGTWRPGAGRLGAGGCGFRRLRFPAAVRGPASRSSSAPATPPATPQCPPARRFP